MAADFFRTAELRGATFRQADLSGATFRECDLTGVRIAGSHVADLRITGFDGAVGTVVVDDVDVTAFVAAELDRRHPERVQLRAMRTADDHRAMWDTLERLWSETLERAERLPEPTRHERVDDEWSIVETLRHLVFATDSWVGNMIVGRPGVYSPLGLPPTDYSPVDAAQLGIDLDARPSYAEAAELLTNRWAQVREVLDALTDADLATMRTGVLAQEFGEESHSVGYCLLVLLREHCEHRRFAVRDLAQLEPR